jgi:ATP-dependent DNA helicase RecQ
VKLNTIYGHLYKYVQQGKALASGATLKEEMALDDERLKLGLDAFKEYGSERLKPVFDALDESVTYEQLHLMRVYFLHLKLSA